PLHRVDLIYLCCPNNPTGVAFDRANLKQWVDYARKNRTIILLDGAYTAFIRDPNVPRSIYEVEGAKEVAIEFRSFSKTAGFTGLRCAYTVIPKELKITDAGKTQSLNALWARRIDTKFNGVSYPIQKCAAATFTEPTRTEIKKQIASYLERASFLLENLK